jgi:2-polyprenyl-3-methyl-5-hydroxy-6-metoxy-1,4-benzoquinol methylase
VSERPGLKRNVDVFDRDAAHGRYTYTDQERLSSVMSNSRMSRAILEATDFTGRTVLDVGCGDGTYTLELARAGARRVIGIDPAPNAVALAAQKAAAAAAHNVEFRTGDVYTLRPDEQFDIAVFRGVLHHLPDPRSAVRIAGGLCRQMVILEPNGFNPALKVIEKVSPYHRAHEEQSFMPSTINRWIEAAGGRVASRWIVNLVPMFCPAFAARCFKAVEPWVEAVPGLRGVACGQYVVLAEFP